MASFFNTCMHNIIGLMRSTHSSITKYNIKYYHNHFTMENICTKLQVQNYVCKCYVEKKKKKH